LRNREDEFDIVWRDQEWKERLRLRGLLMIKMVEEMKR
jgi:hypothetical protein